LNTILTYFTSLQHEAFGTATLAVLTFLAAYVASYFIERGKPPESRRFWHLTVRHSATATFLFGLFIIWRSELQNVLLALGAAAAGILVAFKEVWLSLCSFWVRMVKRTYSLDDFIEIDGLTGRVADITWLTTTVAETTSTDEGLSYTGRVVHVPNNRMLLAPLTVENFAGDYTPHNCKLHLPLGADILKAEALLVKAAEKHCQPFYEEGERHLAAMRIDAHLDLPTIQPRVRVHIGEGGHVALLLRCVVPFKERARVEQAILHEFLQGTDDETWPHRPASK
jgi:small-conductance mechanosensitive channel